MYYCDHRLLSYYLYYFHKNCKTVPYCIQSSSKLSSVASSLTATEQQQRTFSWSHQRSRRYPRITTTHTNCIQPPLSNHCQLHRTIMSSTTSTNKSEDDVTKNVRLQKQVLRKEIRTKLKLLSKEEIDQQSRDVWDQLHAMKLYQDAKSIGLFLSMPMGEINTSYAVQHAIQYHKEIYIPQVGENFERPDMDLIQIQTVSPTSDPLLEVPMYQNWPKNKWNIPEPPDTVILKTAQPGDIDLLIVPGLAFDRYGNRLGQGKGYYDRFIARMCGSEAPSPKLVAVALQCQFIRDNSDTSQNNNGDVVRTERTIPVHEHDFPVNWIILPNEIIEVKK